MTIPRTSTHGYIAISALISIACAPSDKPNASPAEVLSPQAGVISGASAQPAPDLALFLQWLMHERMAAIVHTAEADALLLDGVDSEQHAATVSLRQILAHGLQRLTDFSSALPVTRGMEGMNGFALMADYENLTPVSFMVAPDFAEDFQLWPRRSEAFVLAQLRRLYDVDHLSNQPGAVLNMEDMEVHAAQAFAAYCHLTREDQHDPKIIWGKALYEETAGSPRFKDIVRLLNGVDIDIAVTLQAASNRIDDAQTLQDLEDILGQALGVVTPLLQPDFPQLNQWATARANSQRHLWFELSNPFTKLIASVSTASSQLQNLVAKVQHALVKANFPSAEQWAQGAKLRSVYTLIGRLVQLYSHLDQDKYYWIAGYDRATVRTQNFPQFVNWLVDTQDWDYRNASQLWYRIGTFGLQGTFQFWLPPNPPH